MQTFQPGDRFAHYVVRRLLGTGYHGEVYEIVHVQTGDVFALKVIRLADREDPRKVQRALAAAKGSYRVEHANVLSVLDLNCEDDGLVWMRTELLEGESLAELLGRLGRLSPRFALPAAIEAAHGLAAVHEAQIVHRDVKPANLFYVTTTRALKVIDFSIAKVFPDGLSTTAGRRAGLGTLAYMAPEQLEGAAPTPAFDIYGLGMTLFQMLAGRHPFEEALSNTQELTRQQLVEMPPLLADIARLPREVDAVVRRAVAKDPADRYRSVKEMAQALMELDAWLARETAAKHIVIVVPPGEPPPPGDPRSRRDYTPPTVTPQSEQPAPTPLERVLVPGAAGLGGTAPLAGPAGLGGTVPLHSAPEPGQTLPDTPGARLVSLPMPPRRSPWASQRAPAAPAATRSPQRRTTRVRWRLIVVAVVLVSLASLVLAWWLRKHFAAPLKPRTWTGATRSYPRRQDPPP